MYNIPRSTLRNKVGRLDQTGQSLTSTARNVSQLRADNSCARSTTATSGRRLTKQVDHQLPKEQSPFEESSDQHREFVRQTLHPTATFFQSLPFGGGFPNYTAAAAAKLPLGATGDFADERSLNALSDANLSTDHPSQIPHILTQILYSLQRAKMAPLHVKNACGSNDDTTWSPQLGGAEFSPELARRLTEDFQSMADSCAAKKIDIPNDDCHSNGDNNQSEMSSHSSPPSPCQQKRLKSIVQGPSSQHHIFNDFQENSHCDESHNEDGGEKAQSTSDELSSEVPADQRFMLNGDMPIGGDGVYLHGGGDSTNSGHSTNGLPMLSDDLSRTAINGKRNRSKRGQYRKYAPETLEKAVAAVQTGEMSVHKAGTFFSIPHSTLEYKVKERHLHRRKKRGKGSLGSSAMASPPSAALASISVADSLYTQSALRKIDPIRGSRSPRQEQIMGMFKNADSPADSPMSMLNAANFWQFLSFDLNGIHGDSAGNRAALPGALAASLGGNGGAAAATAASNPFFASDMMRKVLENARLNENNSQNYSDHEIHNLFKSFLNQRIDGDINCLREISPVEKRE